MVCNGFTETCCGVAGLHHLTYRVTRSYRPAPRRSGPDREDGGHGGGDLGHYLVTGVLVPTGLVERLRALGRHDADSDLLVGQASDTGALPAKFFVCMIQPFSSTTPSP
jgi:hypothetical protein